jgi:hypothetical protein
VCGEELLSIVPVLEAAIVSDLPTSLREGKRALRLSDDDFRK